MTAIQLPTLYCRRQDGGINQWTIEVDGSRKRTISGKVGGKLVESAWEQCVVKNEGRSNATTPESQALAQAQSDWNKKKARKYSESPDTVDTDKIYQCMLAKDVRGEWDKKTETWKKPHWPKIEKALNEGQKIFVQAKLDGIRCIANKDGLWSREGKRFVSCPHIEEALKPLFAGQPDLILDGELFNFELRNDFNKIASLIKRQKPTAEDIAETAENVQYHIYDVPSVDELFEKRCRGYNALCRVADKPFIVPVETYEVSSLQEIHDLYDLFAETHKQEGAIIRFNVKYLNKRTDQLLKYKVFVDEEFVIVDVHSGVGKAADLACKMSFVNEDGNPFEATTTGSAETRQGYLKDRNNLIGKRATVRYGNRTPDKNVPRWGRIIAIRDYES